MKIQKRLEINGHQAAIYSGVIFSKNHLFTGSGDKFVAKWNLLTGIQEAFSLRCDQAIYQLSLLKNETILAIGGNDGSIYLIDLINKKELKHYIKHKTAIFNLSENSSKNQFYSTDSDGNLAVWDLSNYDLLLFLPLMVGKIRDVLIFENGNKLLLSCQNGLCKVLDTNNFNEITSFFTHEMGQNCARFHPKNENLLFTVGKDGLLKIWDFTTKNLLKSIPAHNFGIYQLEFFNNGVNFVTISRDKSIKFWELEPSNLQELKVIQKIERKNGGHSHSINSLVKIDEFNFITLGDDKRINVWEIID